MFQVKCSHSRGSSNALTNLNCLHIHFITEVRERGLNQSERKCKRPEGQVNFITLRKSTAMTEMHTATYTQNTLLPSYEAGQLRP